MKTIHSVNLTLRPVIETDILKLAGLFEDVDTTRYLFSGKELSLSEATRFIEQTFSSEEDEQFGIGTLVEKNSGSIVGFAGLEPCSYRGKRELELGFTIAKVARNKGYAIEIGMRQIVFGFEDLKCRRLLGLVHPQNAPSIHILKDNLRMEQIDEIEMPDRGPRQVFCLERGAYLKTLAFYLQ